MKTKHGFTIIELMVAIAMSASIIAIVVSSFASLNGSFLYSNNLMNLNQNLRVAMNLMVSDVQNAGVFGNYSFHNQLASYSYESANTGSACTTNDWCVFNNSTSGMGVGVHSYRSTFPVNIIPGSATLDSNSDILRVQYGSSNIAPLDFTSANKLVFGQVSGVNRCISQLTFKTDRNVTTSKVYMLTSANRAYLLNFSAATAPNSILGSASNTTCNVSNQPYIPIESYSTSVATNTTSVESSPDAYTMTLSNFNVRYYFVATTSTYGKGLYMRKLLSDNTLSAYQFISKNVTSMTISYQVLYSSAAEDINNYDPTAGSANLRYYTCDTTAMNNSGNANCYNKWNRIVGVNITLNGQSDNQVSSTGGYLTQSMTENVGWTW